LIVVAVAPGAAGPTDGPPDDGTLDSLFEPRAGAVDPPEDRARTGPAEARTTTINLSGADDPAPGRRPGAVPIRDIVGSRPRARRWPGRARRTARIGGWTVGAATVGAGLLALWVLLFSTVSGGDVWLGHPLSPASKDEPARQNAVDPAGSGAASVKPTPTAAPPKPTATHPVGSAGSAGAPRSSAEATHHGGGSSAAAGGGTATSGRNGAGTAPEPGDDSGGHGGSGSSGGGSGSSGGGSGSSGGGHGSDD
jgi:hypothetical protein